MSYETLQFAMRESVAVITLNRPEALNALTTQVAIDFTSAFAEARQRGARAIVLTGAGRAFCAGGDLREMQTIAKNEGRLEAFFDEPLQFLHDCVLMIRQTPLPVIAGESAKFNEAFIRIGLTPDCGGTFILPRLTGWKIAAELMMTGDVVTAARARELGMINGVVADADLMPEAFSLADRLAAAPTAAIARIKRLLEQSATSDLATQLELERTTQIESGQTKDFREGVAAFLEKRSPEFTGE